MNLVKNITRFMLLPVLMVLFLADPGIGQEVNQQQEGGAHYVIPGMGQSIKIRVNLWGEVSRPGIYTIPTDVSLVTLISSAGGPTNYAKLSEVRIIRTDENNGQSRVITVDMEDYVDKADQLSTRIELRPNDTVYVPSSFRRYFSETLGIAATVSGILSTLALMYERLWRAGVF